MATRNFIAVSLGLNLVLAGAVVYLAKSRFAAPPEKTSIVTKVVANVSAQTSGSTPQTVTNFSPPAAFHWGRIESAEYPVYIANLRQVSCPEKTIRNILIPDLEELYDKRRRDELQPAATNFWVTGRARAALNHERFRKETALDDEEAALIKQLLGIDWSRQRQRRSGNFFYDFESIALPYLMTTSLPMEKVKEFGALMQKYEYLSRRIQREANDILLPEDERKMKDLKTQLKAGVARLLPPEELEEMNFRTCAIGGHDLFENLKDSPLTLSPDEYRKIVRLQIAPMEAYSYDIFDIMLHNSEPAPQERKQAEQAIKSLLGDARYTMFQEATDDDFGKAKSFVEKEHLPAATSRALFDIQKAAEERAAEIRADNSLSAADRKHALQEIRATTEAALAQMFDAKTLQTYYREQGNNWLLVGIAKNKK